MVAGSRGIRWPSSAPQDAARPRSWPHRLCLCAGFRLAPSGDAVGGVVAFVVCAYRACLLRDDAFDVFLTQRGAQQRRPVDRYAQSIVAMISPYGLSISSEWTALRSAMVAGTGSGFGSATGFVEADSALRGASPKGMRGELFITCLLGDFLSKIPGICLRLHVPHRARPVPDGAHGASEDDQGRSQREDEEQEHVEYPRHRGAGQLLRRARDVPAGRHAHASDAGREGLRCIFGGSDHRAISCSSS